MNVVFRLFLLLLFCLSVAKGLHFARDGFTPRRLQPLSNTSPLFYGIDDKALSILSQPFHYLGRGRQCFAFESLDGKYVLKFPRTDIHQPSFWVRALSAKSYRERLEMNHTKRYRQVRDSLILSYHDLKEETSVLAVHVQSAFEKTLTLVDALGISYRIPMASSYFVLQCKQPIWTQIFLDLLDHQDHKSAEAMLVALVDAVVERGKKGILNRDRSFLRNYGFDGKKVIQIDIGSFFRIPDMDLQSAFQKSVRDSIAPVREWLFQVDPRMQQVLDEKLVASGVSF